MSDRNPTTDTAGLIYEHFVSKFAAPTKGDLRIWIPQLPGKHFWWPVKDLEQASQLLDALAAYDDFQVANRIKGDHCSMGGLCVYQSGDWEHWESEDYDDFDTFRRTP